MLPADVASIEEDRTIREVVAWNLFVALQEALALATHWVADTGRSVPESYREIFTLLADDASLPADLASRLSASVGLPNLIAHQYGALDWARIYSIAAEELDDLTTFCRHLSEQAD